MARQKSRESLYNGMPSVTERRWGPDRSSGAETYGAPGLRGYGDFTTPAEGRHAPDRPARGHRGKGPSGYVRSDTGIADEIYDRMTHDDTLDATEILLQVEQGIVTLAGNVPTRAMKHRAEDIAAATSGARDVRNEIRVDDGSASAGPPGKAVRVGRD
ncbi:MAG: BON domain-containing protein [Pseudomonadota bacterium]|nr:BON domain-containing protein [Pseudomonadota bacterium]